MKTQLNSTQLGTKLRHTSTQKGFTLIELIFTIVIIGVLAAVAIPKYKDLKENAEINSLAKIISDAQSSIPSAFYNAVSINGENPANLQIDELMTIKGEHWHKHSTSNRYYYAYNGPTKATIDLNSDEKSFTIAVYCNNFTTTTLQNKCKKRFNVNGANQFIESIEF